MTAVSHGTHPVRRSPNGYGPVRDRARDARTRAGDARRKLVIDAVVAAALEGNFRPDLGLLQAVTGMPKTTILSLFGRIHLLYRVVARERADEIVIALRHNARADAFPLGCDNKALAWFVMVGAPRERP